MREKYRAEFKGSREYIYIAFLYEKDELNQVNNVGDVACGLSFSVIHIHVNEFTAVSVSGRYISLSNKLI